MTRTQGIGQAGFAIVAAAAAAMCVTAFFFGRPVSGLPDHGVCLPSPELWPMPQLLSWGLNTLLILLITLSAHLINREYNLIRSTQPVLPAVFLILAASNPWLTERLCTSTVLCAVNLMALSILFGCFRSRNATQQMFVIGTFYSIGSMIQYAFVPFVIPMLLSAIIFKALRGKELLAFGMGIAAPYWLALGLGLAAPSDFRLPVWTNPLAEGVPGTQLLVTLLSAGIALFFGLILGLNNSIKLYAGNSRVNALNLAVDLTGLTAAVCAVMDPGNMEAYLDTLYLAVAVQVANLCALWTLRREWLVVFVPGVVYAGFYIVMLLAA